MKCVSVRMRDELLPVPNVQVRVSEVKTKGYSEGSQFCFIVTCVPSDEHLLVSLATVARLEHLAQR